MDISNRKLTISSKTITLNDFYAIYAFLLTAAACLVGSTGNTILMLGITAMFALLVFRPEHLLGPILLFTIFDDYLLVAGNASASRFLAIFFILGTVISVFQKGTLKKASLYFIVLIFFGVLLSFYSTQGYTSFPLSYVLNIILAIAMINLSATSPEKLPKQLYRYAVLTLAYVYFLFAQNGFDSLVEGNRMTVGDDVNSNQLAMGLALAMGLLVANLLLFKKHTFLNILLIAANLVALFLTGSRTALLAAVIAALLLCIINAQDKRSKGKAFLFLILSVALLILIYNIMQKSFPLLMERFTVDNVEESGGTGRFDVWENYFVHFFPRYWFIGMGFDPANFYYGLGTLNVTKHGAHNVVVEILSSTGIVGMILYVVCFAKFFRTTGKQLRTNKYLLLPIVMVITILINGIGENILPIRFLWFGIGLGYMLLNTTNKESKELPGGNHDAC